MITIGIMKRSHLSGAVKKMLHVPTLKLFAIKEEAIQTTQKKQVLSHWIKAWQANVSRKRHFVRVYECFWNVPEGGVSSVMEHLTGGSLQNLMESIGALSEHAIKRIARSLLLNISDVHRKF